MLFRSLRTKYSSWPLELLQPTSSVVALQTRSSLVPMPSQFFYLEPAAEDTSLHQVVYEPFCALELETYERVFLPAWEQTYVFPGETQSFIWHQYQQHVQAWCYVHTPATWTAGWRVEVCGAPETHWSWHIWRTTSSTNGDKSILTCDAGEAQPEAL